MGWCVLYLKPRSEKKVAKICEAHDIPHYLPMRQTTRVYQRRRVTFTKPLFAGYIFVDWEAETRVHIQRTNHILRIFFPDDETTLICQLEQLKQALLVDPELEAVKGLEPGRLVRIRDGAFAGIEGVLVRRAKGADVRLRVDMVGQSVVLDVEEFLVEPID